MASSNSSVPIITTAEDTQYGYFVSESVAITFVVLYSISSIVHLAEAVRFRMWWLLPTVCLAGLGEIIGWSGRVWGSISPLNSDAFLIQIVATVIAPTPLVAAIFIIFGRLIVQLGPSYSRLTPRLYSAIFVSCDIISLIVQSIGGGAAASADTSSGSRLGGNIMLAGIVFQLTSFIVFIALATEYLVRYYRDIPVRRTQYADRTMPLDIRSKLMIAGLAFASLCVFIRSIYRCAELGDGWDGRIIHTQVYFNVLDGAMIVLTMYTFNFFHPGLLLGPTSSTYTSGTAMGEMKSSGSTTAVTGFDYSGQPKRSDNSDSAMSLA